jgi:orotate phosphoribosyltransferase
MTVLKMPSVWGGISPREVLAACDGLYESPKVDGAYIGPMVGYAARDEDDRQLVGFVYANFAKIEQWPAICCEHVARPLLGNFLSTLRAPLDPQSLTFCGAPLGGLGLARDLATLARGRYIYLEKIITAVKTSTSREKSDLVFKRHEPEPGELIVLVEDVCNNFSTTAKAIRQVEDRGAQVLAILCFLNRSPTIEESFVYDDRSWPIIALWRKAMPEYRQSDAMASPHVKASNVALDPKKDWQRLQQAMRSTK